MPRCAINAKHGCKLRDVTNVNSLLQYFCRSVSIPVQKLRESTEKRVARRDSLPDQKVAYQGFLKERDERMRSNRDRL